MYINVKVISLRLSLAIFLFLVFSSAHYQVNGYTTGNVLKHLGDESKLLTVCSLITADPLLNDSMGVGYIVEYLTINMVSFKLL